VSSRARAPLGIIAQTRPETCLVINLFRDLPPRADEEVFTELLAREGVRIERIVSTGQSTPADKPYDQDHDEWVLLLAGSAGLWIEGEGERDLRPGDHVLIAAHRRHHVTRTAKGEPTIWLAVHFR
jgi:cupin 2 domain-containing protein